MICRPRRIGNSYHGVDVKGTSVGASGTRLGTATQVVGTAKPGQNKFSELELSGFVLKGIRRAKRCRIEPAIEWEIDQREFSESSSRCWASTIALSFVEGLDGHRTINLIDLFNLLVVCTSSQQAVPSSW